MTDMVMPPYTVLRLPGFSLPYVTGTDLHEAPCSAVRYVQWRFVLSWTRAN